LDLFAADYSKLIDQANFRANYRKVALSSISLIQGLLDVVSEY
jgi:hypothetical protein